jgi:predicted GNAT family acetyltransferase
MRLLALATSPRISTMPAWSSPISRSSGSPSAPSSVAERLLAEGITAACLYVDLRNVVSTRCYARIGFKPHCDGWAYHRVPSPNPA